MQQWSQTMIVTMMMVVMVIRIMKKLLVKRGMVEREG